MTSLSHNEFLAKISIMRKIKIKNMEKRLAELELEVTRRCCNHICDNMLDKADKTQEENADNNTL